ncbi:MAG: hypothetical protein LBK94_12855 [Prevotellaceae bacterium]|jgi:hypothetical protein|nr:hypothetical protein [Prevotellaceae bacterium]
MKSKYTTYLLIISVIIIWGLIAKRIFFSGDDDTDAVQTRKSPQNVQLQQADTLYLNYADPFLKTQVRKRQRQSSAKPNLSQPKKEAKQHADNILLQYVGYVKERNNETVSYLIKINGIQQIMKKNDNIDGLKLIKVTADSLFFEKEDNKYSVYIER